jgi:hypothetical protein
MYDGKTQYLVANPLKRYLLNSTMLKSFKYGNDGSLTIDVQKDSPGVAKDANLAARAGRPVLRNLADLHAGTRSSERHMEEAANAAGCWELAIFGLLPIPANRMQLHDWLVVTAEDTTAAGSSPPPQYGQNLLPGSTLRWQCGHVGCKRLRHRGQKLKPGSTSALHCGQ